MQGEYDEHRIQSNALRMHMYLCASDVNTERVDIVLSLSPFIVIIEGLSSRSTMRRMHASQSRTTKCGDHLILPATAVSNSC